MIIRLILWITSILIVLALGIAGFVYISLTSGNGFSSAYVTERITEEVQNRLPNATISLGGTEFFLDINQFAIAVRLKNVDITISDTLSASLEKMHTTLSINDLLNREIIIDDVHMENGQIIYNTATAIQAGQKGLRTVPSTQTDVDTHMDANKKITDMVSVLVYQISTQLRKMINTTAKNIDVSYKDKGMWAKVHIDALNFSNDKKQQNLSYVVDIDTRLFVEIPFDFGKVEGTIKSQFTQGEMSINMTTKGISRDFISGIDMTYTSTDNTLKGDFYNQVNDTEMVSFVRSFVPFVKADTTLALNGQTDGYHLQKGGALFVDYKADNTYGNASLTDIETGWHIKAQVHNLTDELVQHYGKGFIQQTALKWMRDNIHATYNVNLDLIFDKKRRKFTQAITNTELIDARVIYITGLPPITVPQGWVQIKNGVTEIKANTAKITLNSHEIALKNIISRREKDILTANMEVVGDVDVLTDLVFNAQTKLENPYAFATLKQGTFNGTVQTKFDVTTQKMLDFAIEGTVPELQTTYTQSLQDQNIAGTATITDMRLSVKPKQTIIRAKSASLTTNNTPIAIHDIALDIKNNVLWYGANMRGDVAKLVSPMLKHDIYKIDMQQGTFDGKVSLKYYMDKQRLTDYTIAGSITDGMFSVPYKFQNIDTLYFIKTKLMDIQINDEATIFKGDVDIQNTAIGTIRCVKRKSGMSMDFSGVLYKHFVDNFIPAQYMQVRQNIPISVNYTGAELEGGTLKITADLQKMDLEFPILQWQKDTNAMANLVSNVVIKPNKNYEISMLANIKGSQPFYAKTVATMDKQGLKSIDISDINFNEERFDVAGIRKDAKMYWRINADTLTRDTVQAMLDSYKDTLNQDAFDIDVQFKIENFIGYNGIAISPVEGHLIQEQDTIKLFETRMTLLNTETNNRFYVYYSPEKYRMITEDLGMFYGSMSKTNIFGNGGRIAMVADADTNGTLVGKMEAKDITITNTPDAVRILKLFSVVGVFEAFESKDINLKKIQGKFRLKQGRFESNNISGLGSVGISAKGYADFKTKQLDVNGMILPTYKISSIIGKIPILGQILTGVDGQGFLSQYYTAQGTFDDHRVTINPMSLFTVGILRDIFAPAFGAENVPLQIE